MNKTIGILFPDGVGVRNFLYGNLIQELQNENCKVVLLHFLPEAIKEGLPEGYSRDVTFVKLPESRERFFEMLYRRAKVFGQLFGRIREDNSQVVMDMQFRHKPKRLKSRLMQILVFAVAKLHSNVNRLQKLDVKHQNHIRKNASLLHYQALLKEFEIDVLMCTHQRASKAVPVVEAANVASIPTATFIYSWDNLPKGRMAVMPKHYFVWSSFMMKQLQTYYPELDLSRIHITGTPQFEPYFDKGKLWTKELFIEKLGLNAARPIICYSGDDETTSPFDEYYLKDIAEAFRTIPIEKRPQLVFRACPVDHSGRFGWVLDAYPEIKNSPPLWKSYAGNWTQILPTHQDLELLVNITQHCDAVVNVASTMCFDFALLGKPGVFINYNQAVTSEKEPYYNLKRGYEFPHFKVVHALQPIHWLNSREDIPSVFLALLDHPGAKDAERNKWVEQMTDGAHESASNRIAKTLINLK